MSMLTCIIFLLLLYVDLLFFSRFLVCMLKIMDFQPSFWLCALEGHAAVFTCRLSCVQWYGRVYLGISVFSVMSPLVCSLSRRVSLDFQTLGHFFQLCFCYQSLFVSTVLRRQELGTPKRVETVFMAQHEPRRHTVCAHLESQYSVVPEESSVCRKPTICGRH